jgi:DNA-binding LacI/PurR family transcriptional regulator
LGLSKATVSLALRNKGTLSVRTRERVKAAALALGYVPDPLLSALVSRRKGVRLDRLPIAFVAGEDTWGVREMYAGMVAGADAMGYGCEFLKASTEKVMAQRIRELWHRGCRGMVFHHVPGGGWLKNPVLRQMSLIQCRLGMHPLPLTTVRSGILFKTQETYARVVDAGYKRIGSLILKTTADGSHPEDLLRLGAEGMVRSKFQDQVRFTESLLITPDQFSHTEWSERTQAWFKKQKPDAVVMTLSSFRHLFKEELPPAAYILINQDDPEAASLSGMMDNTRLIGRKCLDMIDQHIRTNQFGIPEHPYELVMPSVWQEGLSLSDH